MALVSYDVSDMSDSDEEADMTKKTNVLTASDSSAKGTKSLGDNLRPSAGIPSSLNSSNGGPSNVLFTAMPTAKKSIGLMDSDLIKKLLLNKPNDKTDRASKKTVKIAIPALSEFDDELPRPIAKKVSLPSQGSGLCALLPPPKNSGPAAALKLLPDILKKGSGVNVSVKMTQNSSMKNAPKTIPNFPRAAPKFLPKPVVISNPIVKAPLDDNESDEDDDTEDFFSLKKPQQSEAPVDLPLDEHLKENPPSSIITVSDGHSAEVILPQHEPSQLTNSEYETAEFIPVSTDNLELDEEALQKLCGGNKRKRNALQAQLIDVSEKDVVPNASDWLIKSLTEEKRTRSHKKSGGPSSQQKRKHQITYLAFQAKEQEQDLQNQWAANKATKQQTQSKYGF